LPGFVFNNEWKKEKGLIQKSQSAFIQPVKRGKPAGSSENTSSIATSAPYRFIRHPLYASLILYSWGVALKNPDLLSVTVAMAATICYFFTSKVEEEEMIVKFGDTYKDYIRRTKMFIPFIF
jgi:protein-S-isoprenylcysteine O-methyltransferase Ste14